MVLIFMDFAVTTTKNAITALNLLRENKTLLDVIFVKMNLKIADLVDLANLLVEGMN